MLLDCDWVVGTSFDIWIVGNYHTRSALDDADSGYDTSCWDYFLSVEVVPGKLRELKEGST